MQFNKKNEPLGANPHFRISKRTVCLTNTVERSESELDGAFIVKADHRKKNKPDSGAYPFVFDLPDFKTIDRLTSKNLIFNLLRLYRIKYL